MNNRTDRKRFWKSWQGCWFWAAKFMLYNRIRIDCPWGTFQSSFSSDPLQVCILSLRMSFLISGGWGQVAFGPGSLNVGFSWENGGKWSPMICQIRFLLRINYKLEMTPHIWWCNFSNAKIMFHQPHQKQLWFPHHWHHPRWPDGTWITLHMSYT